jgi:hypothetical protein
MDERGWGSSIDIVSAWQDRSPVVCPRSTTGVRRWGDWSVRGWAWSR